MTGVPEPPPPSPEERVELPPPAEEDRVEVRGTGWSVLPWVVVLALLLVTALMFLL